MTHREHESMCKSIKCARIHLKNLCKKVLQSQEIILSEEEEIRESQNLVSIILTRNEDPLSQFLLPFINRTVDPPVLQAMAKLLLLLASNCEISCIVPCRYHYHILQTCAAVENNMSMPQTFD